MHKKYNNIKIEISKNTLCINLDRPEKKNALNPEMISEIKDVLNQHEKHEHIRVVVISSTCDVFCAGADIAYLNKIIDFNYEKNLNDSKILMSLFKTMLLYPKLIISKVCGPAIAGGCGLITASDIVFGTNNSKYGYPEVKIGFTAALVSTFLIDRINTSKTKELLLTGKLINANKAYEIGLINYIYNESKIDTAVFSFIKEFTRKTAPNSIARTKEIIYLTLDLDKKLEIAAKINAKSRENNDFKRGITSFLNKETINWEKS